MRLELSRAALLLAAAFASLGILPLGSLSADDAPAKPVAPGLGDPGQLQAVRAETGREKDGLVTISGRDSAQQIVVSGEYSSGQTRDLTRTSTYEASNQIVPVFTKYGCNGGGCHGKSGGQNGFRLSLLGFEPTEDYEYLVKEARGRRLFPAAPDRSLLLRRRRPNCRTAAVIASTSIRPPTACCGAGSSRACRTATPTDPVVTGIEVLPKERLMGRDSSQQLVVVAHYSDGSTEDVTRMTQFDSNDTEMAEVSVTGLVTTPS
jgi:hypothetical protein